MWSNERRGILGSLVLGGMFIVLWFTDYVCTSLFLCNDCLLVSHLDDVILGFISCFSFLVVYGMRVQVQVVPCPLNWSEAPTRLNATIHLMLIFEISLFWQKVTHNVWRRLFIQLQICKYQVPTYSFTMDSLVGEGAFGPDLQVTVR